MQRTACIGATGALRYTPTEALNVLFHLLPPHIHINYQPSCSAIRLRESGCWVTKHYGHSSILESTPRGSSTAASDYITPILNFVKGFSVRIPTRNEWRNTLLINSFDIALYTDGSKMECGVGAGMFSGTLDISESYRLPDGASVFQAEVLAILKACSLLESAQMPMQNIAIFTDSQAAIKALGSVIISFKLVRDCREKLVSVGNRCSVTLLWVPGHRNIPGNEKADVLHTYLVLVLRNLPRYVQVTV